MTLRVGPVVVVLMALLASSACTDDQAPDESPATAVATPVASPSDESPTQEPSADPTPTPSASPADGLLSEAAALAAARRHQVERGDCDGAVAADAHTVLANVDGRLLVYVVCLIGAYQPSGELLVWDGLELLAVPVEQWQFGTVVDSAEVVGFLEGAPGSPTVANELLYRALGDCGLRQRWTFEGDRVRLDLARELECGDDGGFVPPGAWPVVYER